MNLDVVAPRPDDSITFVYHQDNLAYPLCFIFEVRTLEEIHGSLERGPCLQDKSLSQPLTWQEAVIQVGLVVMVIGMVGVGSHSHTSREACFLSTCK